MKSGSSRKILQYLAQPRTWLAALVGIAAMESFLRLAPRAGLSRIDFPNTNGTLFLPPGPKATLLGAGLTFAGSMGWATLFRVMRSRMRHKGSPILAGLAFGTGLFFFSSLAVFPPLGSFHPLMRRGAAKRPGFFGLGLNGWRTAVSNLLAHGIYGLVLGLSETLTPSPQRQTREDRPPTNPPSRSLSVRALRRPTTGQRAAFIRPVRLSERAQVCEPRENKGLSHA